MKLIRATAPDGTILEQHGGSWIPVAQKSTIHPFLRGLAYGTTEGEKLTSPYAQSVWVMRAIKRVAEPIAAVPLTFFEETKSGETEIADLNLANFWKAPARDRSGLMDFSDFIEASVGWLKLSGEAFWLLGDDWITARFSDARSPLLIARPDRMRAIIRENRLEGWEFTDAEGRKHPQIPEQVIHLKFWNPYDDLRGMAEYEAAKVATEADYLSGRFALHMARSNGDRGVYVIAKGGMPTDAQREQMIAALREKKAAAARGEYKPVFLTGDVAIEDPKIAAPDVQFVAQRLQNRHEIFIAFGVPPSMADLVANFSIGQASDRYMLISETSMPLANGKLSGGIEKVSRLFFPGRRDQLTARFNFDNHPVMQQVRAERTETAIKLWGTGVPMKILSEYLGLGLPKFKGDDVGYLPFSVAPVGEEPPMPSADAPESGAGMADEPAAPKQEDPKQDEKIEAMVKALRNGSDPVALVQDAFKGGAAVVQLGARNPKRVALWKAHMRGRSAATKRFRSKITKVLMIARADVLAKIDRSAKQLSALTVKAAAADFLFDLDGFRHLLSAEVRKAARATLQEAGQALLQEAGKGDDVFSMPPQEALDFLATRENRMKDVAGEIFERIKRELDAGLDAGDSTADLAKRIKAEFNEIDDGRALTVAQTETAAAYGVARQAAMEKAGITHKEWLTSGLDNVRATHLEAEGQRVAADEPFHVGGEDLMHPGDPDGSPENVINCHCVSIPVAGPASDEEADA